MATGNPQNVIWSGKRQVGLRNVGSYQISGAPWLSGSTAMHSHNHQAASGNVGVYRTNGEGTSAKPAEIRVNFPYVTKKFTIVASGSSALIRVHFASMYREDTQGSPKHNNIIERNHFIQLDGDEESLSMDVKCKEVYLSTVNTNSAFQIYAELTNIPTGSMYALTGSGITD